MSSDATESTPERQQPTPALEADGQASTQRAQVSASSAEDPLRQGPLDAWGGTSRDLVGERPAPRPQSLASSGEWSHVQAQQPAYAAATPPPPPMEIRADSGGRPDDISSMLQAMQSMMHGQQQQNAIMMRAFQSLQAGRPTPAQESSAGPALTAAASTSANPQATSTSGATANAAPTLSTHEASLETTPSTEAVHSELPLPRLDPAMFERLVGKRPYQDYMNPYYKDDVKSGIPTWKGNDPARNLKPWLRELRMWRHGTSIPVSMHGVKLFHSFDRDSKMKQLALRVPEEKVYTIEGYDLIMAEILPQYRMFLEQDTDVQIEKTMFMIRRDEKELFIY